MALSAAEKQRRYHERRDADLERRQKYLDLKKAKYRQDLAIGKRKKIAQMSKRQKRTMRRRWRQQKQDLKERKQMLENLVTPPVSPSHPTEPGTSRLTRSFIRSPDGTESTPRTNRDIKIESAKKAKVSKCYRDLARKNFTIKILQKKVDSLRKALGRERRKISSTMSEECTPRKRTRNIMLKSKKTISRTLLFHHTMLAQMRRDKKEGQRYMMKLLSGQLLRKYKLRVREFKTIGCCFRKKARNNKGSLSTRLRTHVLRFLQRDDVSRLTSGK